MRTSSAKPNFLPFLSTPSARRATVRCGLLPPTRYDFYPRPPRGGRPGQRHCADHLQNFYPRPPRGGRPATALHRGKAAVFLSTPSARRATFWRFRNGLCDEISIHALREEGDPLQSPPCALLSNFYPRPPRGGRLLTQQEITQINDFYPRPPRGGRPSPTMTRIICCGFLSTPSARRATQTFPLTTTTVQFLSTPSARRAT